MRGVTRLTGGLASLTLVAGLSAAVVPAAAAAAPPEFPSAGAPDTAAVDELPNPLEEKRRELREAGLTKVLNGEAVPEQRGASTVVRVGDTAAPGDSNDRWTSTSSWPERRPTRSS